jgi:NTP pyrophosphatase (non-canonical NTP hydrolase)
MKSAEMDANEYQRLCERTAGGDVSDRITYTAMGLSGEAGEVLDETKKLLFHNHPYDRDRFLKELGDTAWYLAMCSLAHGFTLAEVMEANIEKLEERYPGGFSAEASINRKK